MPKELEVISNLFLAVNVMKNLIGDVHLMGIFKHTQGKTFDFCLDGKCRKLLVVVSLLNFLKSGSWECAGKTWSNKDSP